MRFVFSLFILCGLAAAARADSGAVTTGTAAPPVVPAENLLPEGNFEAPFVTGRTPAQAGGDPTNNGKGPGWISFRTRTSGKNGNIIAGLTNEVARNGKQSLFVRFDHVNGSSQALNLVSDYLPVVSGSEYTIGIWGRTDAKDLIDSEGRSAYLKLEVDYYAKDANESVGEPDFHVQPLPGSKDHDPYFHPDRWDLFFVTVTPPPGAVFAQITWSWETGSDKGEVNGIMYFDDATMMGPPAANPNMTPSPVQEASPAAGQ